jgi:hypothetical protein
MALLELNDNNEARRLQNNGYSRTGRKSVETDFQNLKQLITLLQDKVNKVVIHRDNGDEEAEFLDYLIENRQEGHHKEIYKFKRGGTKIKQYNRKVCRIKENKATIYRNFKEIVCSPEEVFPKPKVTVNLKNEEKSFSNAKEEVVEAIEEEIQELKSKKQDLVDKGREEWVNETF